MRNGENDLYLKKPSDFVKSFLEKITSLTKNCTITKRTNNKTKGKTLDCEAL